MNPNSTPPEGLYDSVATSGVESKDRDTGATNEAQAGVQRLRYSDSDLHARQAHPDWEYAATEGPRKQWDEASTPPYGDDGKPDTTWQPNTDRGRDGWERFDYTEESYWRRPKTSSNEEPDEETPLQAAQASIDLRDAVIDVLNLRAETAEAKVREQGEGTPDPRAVLLDAISTALNAVGCWLPIEGKRAVVDAVLKATRSGETCCVCRAAPATYRNFREQPFCWPCADCRCNETPCIRDANQPAGANGGPPGQAKELRVGDKGSCRHCGLELIWEPWFRDGRGPNPPIWSHTHSGTVTCSTKPKGWRGKGWPNAQPTEQPEAST